MDPKMDIDHATSHTQVERRELVFLLSPLDLLPDDESHDLSLSYLIDYYSSLFLLRYRSHSLCIAWPVNFSLTTRERKKHKKKKNCWQEGTCWAAAAEGESNRIRLFGVCTVKKEEENLIPYGTLSRASCWALSPPPIQKGGDPAGTDDICDVVNLRSRARLFVTCGFFRGGPMMCWREPSKRTSRWSFCSLPRNNNNNGAQQVHKRLGSSTCLTPGLPYTEKTPDLFFYSICHSKKENKDWKK